MRTLAIDLGQKRVGLALSDQGGRFATPLEVLQVSSSDRAIEPILKLIDREGIERVVLGLPLNMDGTIGAAAKQTIHWARQLEHRVHKPVVFVDERLSSFEAEQALAARKRQGERITRQRKRESLDALAAAAILQEFLDGKLRPLVLDEE